MPALWMVPAGSPREVHRGNDSRPCSASNSVLRRPVSPSLTEPPPHFEDLRRFAPMRQRLGPDLHQQRCRNGATDNQRLTVERLGNSSRSAELIMSDVFAINR